MPGLIAHDAEKRLFNASKAISARKFDDSQEKWKELLVCPVEGGGQTKNQRTGALLKNKPSQGGIRAAGDSQADQ